jgi:hypothetical protein
MTGIEIVLLVSLIVTNVSWLAYVLFLLSKGEDYHSNAQPK